MFQTACSDKINITAPTTAAKQVLIAVFPQYLRLTDRRQMITEDQAPKPGIAQPSAGNLSTQGAR